ncbi:MAG: 4Fe-4S dicluster domain-containing protein [Candidatus Heimdallarchaeota archaeon]
MVTKFLPSENLQDFIEFLLQKKYKVIAPVRDENGVNFEIIGSSSEITLDYINTKYSPKKFFLPDDEILFRFEKRGKKIKLIESFEKEKRVIFGIRPCDVNALLVLDKLLIDKTRDAYYIAKRKNTLLFAVDCIEAGKNCFCYVFGMDKLTSGYDLLFTPVKSGFFVRAGSREGEKMMKESKHFKAAGKPPKINLKFKKKFRLKDVESKLEKFYDDERWKDVARNCISCAACTEVCPTCYCFEVKDYVDFDGSGERVRHRSSCLLKSFSRVAGDFVFRKSRVDRIKQFVYHKLLYFKEKHGVQLCVGCGRCIDVCPTGIDFFKESERIVGVKR